MDPIKKFERERNARIRALSKNKNLKALARKFLVASAKKRYHYNFSWLGRPIIQYPEDIVAVQELIWALKPDLIIETGIAHGGSLILSASILELIGGKGEVVGIDIDIRKYNRRAVENHRMSKRIIMIEGSSIDAVVVRKVHDIAKDKKKILVFLDSNHTHEHVLAELYAYAPLVSKGSYLVVFDTVTEYMPREVIGKRPWGKGNNPLTAVHEFLRTHKNFVVDAAIENKLLITVAPGGFLRRVK